jgi:hypothetical protein
MNERIRELALQAKEYARSFNYQHEVFEKKFAELIVRECGKFCGHDAAGVKAMYEHFGISELFNKDFGVE